MSKHSILRLDCSPSHDGSLSRLLADRIVDRLTDPSTTIVCRDLHARPTPFIDAPFSADMRRYQTAEMARSVSSLANSETLIGELEVSNILVLSTPMHNFTVPAVLKTWIDQVVRFGRTFRSTPDGKIGLLRDRPALVAISAGGALSQPAGRQPDFLRPYLTAILATIGIRDVTFYLVEGTSRDSDKAWSDACAQLAACPRLQSLSSKSLPQTHSTNAELATPSGMEK